jgi:hypothetical protein
MVELRLAKRSINTKHKFRSYDFARHPTTQLEYLNPNFGCAKPCDQNSCLMYIDLSFFLFCGQCLYFSFPHTNNAY